MVGRAGGEKTVVDPLRRLANTVGRDSKLSTRGTLVDGELRSAQGPGSAPPVWFVFTGDCTTSPQRASRTSQDPGKALSHLRDVLLQIALYGYWMEEQKGL